MLWEARKALVYFLWNLFCNLKKVGFNFVLAKCLAAGTWQLLATAGGVVVALCLLCFDSPLFLPLLWVAGESE